MKQHNAVITALEKLGGQATFAELYSQVMKIKDCIWGTKTPFASIRRIVQQRPEIFKVRPGLWALHSYKDILGLTEYTDKKDISSELIEQNHSYYQGILVSLGNLRGFSTYVPNQDKNKLFVNKPLKALRSLQELPAFSHDFLVKRSSTIDVIWFNNRLMPDSFFEVEYSTDIQNSLLKFYDLRDFHARMVIVADENRKENYNQKISRSFLADINSRVKFLNYNTLVRQFESEVFQASQTFTI